MSALRKAEIKLLLDTIRPFETLALAAETTLREAHSQMRVPVGSFGHLTIGDLKRARETARQLRDLLQATEGGRR
jgi:hypothetical protein